MKIIINGIHANLRFSSAHIIPSHDLCGSIHGHSYFVDVEIEGERSGKFEFVADFKDVKDSVRKICEKLDHKVLIPINNADMEFKGLNSSNKLILNDFKDAKYLNFAIQNKNYKLPIEDCVLLPLKHTSAEELSKYFTCKLFEDIQNKGYNIATIALGVNEGIGQGALFKKEF
ncbi:MAG: 6-carboxytetrahydropterin synthase [Methanobacteriaceae archaeon]|jgi:6-pyruvoyltetrahydropterin/6-carboxytetrahydropterin synthase|nr:6-carboxytetrahydropterin synthase [Candidatus Methanorudis spinitermitis]